ncbi:MAG: CUB domain-containing protein [Flavobacteriales bacterium]|nr:CUB domain-containing protein [Flavobacteriales bacterium]
MVGNSIPDISSTGLCITLEFYSDPIVQYSGWAATVICGPPPPPPPPPGTGCGNTYLDPGGNGNYANNVDVTQTICAPAGQVVNLTFNSFNLESNWDRLYVYDGPNTGSPLISSGNGIGIGPGQFIGPGAFWGSGIPGPFISSGQCLTFRFYTDFSVTYSGWSALISCAPRAPNDNPCAPFPATVLTVNPTCTIPHPTIRMLALRLAYRTPVVVITKAAMYGSNSPALRMGRYDHLRGRNAYGWRYGPVFCGKLRRPVRHGRMR